MNATMNVPINAPLTVPAAPPAGAVAFGQKLQRALQALVYKMAPPQFTLMNLVADRWRADALGALVRLGVADGLGTEARSADDLARELQLNADALYRVLRALARDGLLNETGDRRFSLNGITAPLRRTHPHSMANMVLELSSVRNPECWSRLPEALKTGREVWSSHHDRDMWSWLDARPEEHAIFHGAMTELTREGAGPFARGFPFGDFDSVVDLGGGTGRLLANVLAAHPRSRGVLIDHASVVAQSSPVFERYAVTDRVEVISGNLFADAPPPGKGVYLLKHILHGADDVTASSLPPGAARRCAMTRGSSPSTSSCPRPPLLSSRSSTSRCSW